MFLVLKYKKITEHIIFQTLHHMFYVIACKYYVFLKKKTKQVLEGRLKKRREFKKGPRKEGNRKEESILSSRKHC